MKILKGLLKAMLFVFTIGLLHEHFKKQIMEDIFYYPGMLFPLGTRTYREMGSRNKKTGKLNEYDITIGKKNKGTCTCPAMAYRPYQECKHVKRLKEKLCIQI